MVIIMINSFNPERDCAKTLPQTLMEQDDIVKWSCDAQDGCGMQVRTVHNHTRVEWVNMSVTRCLAVAEVR